MSEIHIIQYMGLKGMSTVLQRLNFCRNRKKKKISPKIMLPLLLAFIGWGMFKTDQYLMKKANDYASFQCRQLASSAVNQTVEAVLQNQQLFTDDLYVIHYDAARMPVLVETNAIRLNQIRDTASQILEENLLLLAGNVHDVPLSALMGSYTFTQLDPRLKMEVYPNFYIKSDIETSLQANGINQSEFEIAIVFDIGISTSLINYESHSNMNIQVPLVKLLLMGETPQYYSGR